MPINFNGTKIEKIVYNGTELTRVIYNGVVVWEASKFPWYVRPEITVSSAAIKFVNKLKDTPLLITIKPDKGVTFDSTESDPNIDNTIRFTLIGNETRTKPWYWIGDFAQPSTIDFWITIKEWGSLELIESFYVSYEEETTTTTTYSTAKEISTDGNFTLYRIEK